MCGRPGALASNRAKAFSTAARMSAFRTVTFLLIFWTFHGSAALRRFCSCPLLCISHAKPQVIATEHGLRPKVEAFPTLFCFSDGRAKPSDGLQNARYCALSLAVASALSRRWPPTTTTLL